IRDRNVTGVQTCALPICDKVVLAAELSAGAALERVLADVSCGIPSRIPRCEASHRNRLALVLTAHETVRPLRSACVRVGPDCQHLLAATRSDPGRRPT